MLGDGLTELIWIIVWLFSYYFDFYTDTFNLYVFVNDYIETFVTDLFFGLTEARLFLTRPPQDRYVYAERSNNIPF